MTEQNSQEKRRTTFAARIRVRNTALRNAKTVAVIEIIGRKFHLTDTQIKILKDLREENPNLRAIARNRGIAVRNIHSWAFILGIKGKGRKQTPHNKLSDEMEQAIDRELEEKNPNLTSIARKFAVARNTVNSRAARKNIAGHGDKFPPHPKWDEIVLELYEFPEASSGSIAAKLGISKAWVNKVRRAVSFESRERWTMDSQTIIELMPSEMKNDYEFLLPLIHQQGYRNLEALRNASEVGAICIMLKNNQEFERLHRVLSFMFPDMKRNRLGMVETTKAAWPTRPFLKRTQVKREPK